MRDISPPEADPPLAEKPELKIAIIDYGMGNLFSVKQACEYAGISACIVSGKRDLLNADAAILPGVGAFGDAISNLKSLDLIIPIRDFINTGKPFMGICLGMQLLMTESEEFGIHKGLDMIKGHVVKFSPRKKMKGILKIPQVGWNQIFKPDYRENGIWDNSLLKALDDGDFMYFVHSFYAVPFSKDIVLSVSTYEGIEYCSSIENGNVFACQFHPEKSANNGIRIYKNFFEKVSKRPTVNK